MMDATEAFRKDTEEQLRVTRVMLTGDNPVKSIEQMIILREANGKLVMALMPDVPAGAVPIIIKHLAGIHAADRVYILSEAWITITDRAPGTPGYIPPSESDSRQEALLVFAVDKETHSMLCMYQIIERHPDGSPYFPHEPINMPMADGGGRYHQLLEMLWGDSSNQSDSKRLN